MTIIFSIFFIILKLCQKIYAMISSLMIAITIKVVIIFYNLGNQYYLFIYLKIA